MLTIDTPQNNVLHVTCVDTLTRDDIGAIQTAMQKLLAIDGPLGLLIDLNGWTDMTGDAIRADLSFEVDMMLHIHRFAKIAIVSDKEWPGAMVAFAGGLLPGTDMRAFTVAHRDAAARFAADLPNGRTDDAEPGIRVVSDDGDYFEVAISGHMAERDLKPVITAMNAALDRPGKLNVLVHLTNPAGFDVSIMGESGLWGMKGKAIRDVGRYALVGAPAWMEFAAKTAARVMPMDVRTFDVAELNVARDWARTGADAAMA